MVDWLKLLVYKVSADKRSPGDRKLMEDSEKLKEERQILPEKL